MLLGRLDPFAGDGEQERERRDDDLLGMEVEVVQLVVQRDAVDGVLVHLKEVIAQRQVDGGGLELLRRQRLDDHRAVGDELFQSLVRDDHNGEHLGWRIGDSNP